MYHRVNAAGELVQSEKIDVGGPTMMHDFAITENYVVFMDLPVVFDLEKAMSSMSGEKASAGDGMPYAWSDDYPARLGVLPRNQPGAAVRWFGIDPCYLFHAYNAFERDGSIVLDVCRYDDLWRERTDKFSTPKPHRFSIDLGTGHVTETPLFDGLAEFPRIDDRLCGLPARYGYAVRTDALPTENTAPRAVVKHDLDRGIETAWEVPAGGVPGEAVFVPAGPAAGEDEGWLLFYMYDANRDGSDLIILDAGNPASGPVARVQLPQRVPFGFHGNFFSDQ
jgi:carotenoid cleavage dioxygenase